VFRLRISPVSPSRIVCVSPLFSIAIRLPSGLVTVWRSSQPVSEPGAANSDRMVLPSRLKTVCRASRPPSS